MRRRSFLTLLLSSPLGAAARNGQRVESVQLARAGRIVLPVVIGADATPRVRQAAQELAQVLGKMTGSTPAVTTGDGTRGIVLGLPGQFPALGRATVHASRFAREDYWLSSRAGGVLLIGQTESGVENAVWDFLHRLGYRQFFPGERWEVVPQRVDLSIDVDVHVSPSYAYRHIWYGHGPWDYAAEPYTRWRRRNRMPGAVVLRTGHAYPGIIRGLQHEFDRHPEFYPLIEGVRKPSRNAKLCISNAELRHLVVQYELGLFRKSPALESVSLDPSDGGGWCECADCHALGSISDRVVTLANEVAAAVEQEFPGKLVGIYAYNYHSPPPSIRVHPNVVVSVATAFVRGTMDVDEIMRGWARQGATLGVREYYAVNTWDRDLPAQGRGGNIEYLARTIPEFHRRGARFLSAESSDNWGPNGLGYYLAGRLLWDVGEADRVQEIVDDFLAGAFGAAREPMREFYRLLDGSQAFFGGELLPQRMFLALRDARRLAHKDPAVLARLDDLTLYTQYCVVYRRYGAAAGAERQAAFEVLIRHAYRMRTTMMVHAKALYRDLPLRDRTISIPPGAEWNVPEGRNPWKSSQPFSAEEIEGFVEQGLQPRAPDPAAAAMVFSERLAPVAGLRLPSGERGNWGPASGVQEYFIHVAQPGSALPLLIAAGDGAAPGWKERLRVTVASADHGASGVRTAAVAPPERDTGNASEMFVSLRAADSGLYRVSVASGDDAVAVRFPAGVPVVMPAGVQAPMNGTCRQWDGYFYVPRSTSVVGIVGGSHGELQDGLQRAVFWLNGRAQGIWWVPVPQEQDGTVWRLKDADGAVTLLTVPPYFAPTPGQLLLPVEVVERDAASQGLGRIGSG